MSSGEAPARLQPTAAHDRHVELDVVRGLAVMGVLLAYTLWNLGSPPRETYSVADRVLDAVLTFLIETKFYTLFAFLFGLGFSVQMTRATARGATFVPLYVRRLLGLMVIGLAHAVFLRNGDVLVQYAVVGFLLLLFRSAPNNILLIGGMAAYLWPHLARTAWELTGVPFPRRPETAATDYFSANLAWLRYRYAMAGVWWPASLSLFLLGLYVGRLGIVDRIAIHIASLRRVAFIGLTLGIATYGGIHVLNTTSAGAASVIERYASGALWTVHGWCMAAAYAGGVILLLQKPRWRCRLAPLSAVGRMALTNYLLQAVLIVPICIQFELFDTVTPTRGLLLGAVVGIVQTAASMWWMRRFRFGPAEWAWRSLTYGRLQPMRNERPAVGRSLA